MRAELCKGSGKHEATQIDFNDPVIAEALKKQMEATKRFTEKFKNRPLDLKSLHNIY